MRSRIGARLLDSDADARTLHVAAPDSAARVRALLDELDPDSRLISRFDIRNASLDDVFLTLTGHKSAPKETADV